MRNAVKITGLLLALTLLLAGCGGKEKNLDLNPDELAQAILEEVSFQAELMPISQSAVDNWYFLNDSVAEYAIYINVSVVPAEEIAVLVGRSADDLESLNKILDQRLQNLEESFEGYQPGELPKIQNPVRDSRANVAVLVLTDDPDAPDHVTKLLH